MPFPLLFPFRIGAATAAAAVGVGTAVGDAISTSCGDGRDIPLLAAVFGECRRSAAAIG